MKKSISFILTLIWLGSLPAGQAGLSAQSFVGRNNYHIESSQKVFNSSDTLKILAVMVEFQKDNDRNTYGNGKFGSIYSKDYGTEIIDPLPFDANYFSNHLEFAKNYFKKVSNGKLNIVYKVLPQVITVSDSMRNYAPSPQSASDFSGLGRFATEVWQLASATFPNEDFSKYDLFTIFHAGVGRETPKLSAVDNERDIPSVYLGLKSLRSILGNSFNGFPVNGGKFLITNTMILPSTESHEEATFSGTALVKASINGIMVGNIGTYLGLPDLFNTITGVSAVGRFGLMDGDALFAYSGLFPPEPSAWEKVYLGWVTPVTLSIGDKHVNLAARVAAALNDTTILKIPINSTEYFLIENRQRDANKNGLILTSKIGTQTYTFNIPQDTGKFQWYGVDTLKGVITDVDEPDWAAPGNGIVIWHVDDNIVNANIAYDKINADDNHRGIYVEEADGIFDIGKKIQTLLGEDYGRAAHEDMWYAGNKGHYFKNVFGPDSKPNTNSNSGANSLVTMQNFSAAGNKMDFDVSFGSADLKLVYAQKFMFKNLNSFLLPSPSSNASEVYFSDNGDLNKFDFNSHTGMAIYNFSKIQPVSFKNNTGEFIIGASADTLWMYYTISAMQTIKPLFLSDTVTTLSVNNNDPANAKLLIGTINGSAYSVPMDFLINAKSSVSLSPYLIYKGDGQIINFSVDGNFYSILLPHKIVEHSTQDVSTQFNPVVSKSVLTKDADGTYKSIVLDDAGNFSVVSHGNIVSTFNVKMSNTSTFPFNHWAYSYLNHFSVADLFNDGQNYILLPNGSHLDAYNFGGVMANNFPFVEPNGDNFVGTPLAADINNDGNVEIIACTNRGNIYAINASTGKVVNGFPISSGATIATSPIIVSEPLPNAGPIQLYKPFIEVLDTTGKLYVWNIAPTQGKVYWTGEGGNALNTNFVDVPSTKNKIADFFPADKAYNWPNPVYGGNTQIRYYVSENSDVNIKIFDLAGELVTELNNKATGGMDNETTWNVSNVQSGVYYARLELKGASGATANKIIKIAVIK